MRTYRILTLAALFLSAIGVLQCGGVALAAERDKLTGQPADIAPSACQYRSDLPAEGNAPETAFLFIALKHVKAQTLCGLLWEEPRPVKQVILSWPAEAKNIPKPDQIVLQWFPEGDAASWWCRREGEGNKLHQSGTPQISDDGCQYTYTLDALSNEAALDNLVVAVKDGVAAKSLDVPTVRVLAPQTWKPLTIDIEWGFQEGTQQRDYSGSIAAYNGALGDVTVLTGDNATQLKPDNSWRSQGDASAGRRGVTVELLHIGYKDTVEWPGQADINDANRTIVTLRTRSGSFSFMPADLEEGPILAPEHGFFVAKTSDGITAAKFCDQLKAKRLKTLRERIHAGPEQSWEGAMRAVRPEVKGEWPPFPQPTVDAPMSVDVPEPRLTAAWKIGATDMLRGQKKDARGKWRFRDPPYDALAHETHLFMRVLDVMGLHKEARDGYEMWLDRMDQPVPTPDGLWTGGPGRFFSGIEWDDCHGGGISAIHLAMLDHYLLTGDRQWLAKNAEKLNANADWMVRQRRECWSSIPGHEKLWTNGLLPPHNIWDNRVWRSWYETNACFCYAVQRHAEVIAEVDPAAGKRFTEEAKAFRKDLLAAVEKSLVLSPVVRVRDGTYRSFLPPTPYMRGPASRFMPTAFGARAFGMPMHSPGLYADAIRGGQHLIEYGLTSADDPRMQGYVDVLEDRLLSENFKLKMAWKDYDSEKDWFSRAGWFYQCGLERTANIHLKWDDPACFLRTWFNQYAIEIQPGTWRFKEHTAAHSCMDKPFEEGAFLARFRQMLVREDGDVLKLAHFVPRTWLAQGKRIAVKGAPTAFGAVAYEIVSDVDHGRIAATVNVPHRNPPKMVLLRLRHPAAMPMKNVTVNGATWTDFDPAKEVISLHGVKGTVEVDSRY